MPPHDGIRSQLEWNSTLNTASAPQPTEETKYLRKVRDVSAKITYYLCSYSYRHRSLRRSVCALTYIFHGGIQLIALYQGPKTNSVEKLAELRRAGVNIGGQYLECSHDWVLT